MVEVSLTVGKLDASLALLLTKDHHLIEFPTILLPNGVKAGSIIKIRCDQDYETEKEESRKFQQIQDEILTTFGKNLPKAPKLKIKNVTQTSCVLEWDQLELGTSNLKNLILFKDGKKLGAIPQPLTNKTTKLSGLPVDKTFQFQLRLDTTAGVYSSDVIEVTTHKMTDLSGITVCLGEFGANDPFTVDDIQQTLKNMGAHHPAQEQVKVDTTHFICTRENKQDLEYLKASDMNIPIIRPEWLKACERERRIVGVRDFYLKDCVLPDIFAKNYWGQTSGQVQNSASESQDRQLHEQQQPSESQHDDSKLEENGDAGSNLDESTNVVSEPQIEESTSAPKPQEPVVDDQNDDQTGNDSKEESTADAEVSEEKYESNLDPQEPQSSVDQNGQAEAQTEKDTAPAEEETDLTDRNFTSTDQDKTLPDAPPSISQVEEKQEQEQESPESEQPTSRQEQPEDQQLALEEEQPEQVQDEKKEDEQEHEHENGHPEHEHEHPEHENEQIHAQEHEHEQDLSSLKPTDAAVDSEADPSGSQNQFDEVDLDESKASEPDATPADEPQTLSEKVKEITQKTKEEGLAKVPESSKEKAVHASEDVSSEAKKEVEDSDILSSGNSAEPAAIPDAGSKDVDEVDNDNEDGTGSDAVEGEQKDDGANNDIAKSDSPAKKKKKKNNKNKNKKK